MLCNNIKFTQARSQDFPEGGAKKSGLVWVRDHQEKRSERGIKNLSSFGMKTRRVVEGGGTPVPPRHAPP